MLQNKIYSQRVLLTVLIMLASAGVLLPAGCGSNHFGRDLAAALSQYPATVSFAEIAPFQWSSVEIYGPYTPANRLSPVAARGSSARSHHVLANRDTYHLIVFIQNDAVVYHELLPRSIADFHLDAGQVALRRLESNFAVSHSTDASGLASVTLFIAR